MGLKAEGHALGRSAVGWTMTSGFIKAPHPSIPPEAGLRASNDQRSNWL